MTARVFGAVDVGASGGRVVALLVERDQLILRTLHQFPNRADYRAGRLRWDITRIYDEILVGLHRLGQEFPQVESIGVDTWGVDYGLLDDDGELLADPVSYRDDRTRKAVERVHGSIDHSALYAINGLQYLPFTTLYQLSSEQEGPLWNHAAHVVLLPDLLSYWLTGLLGTELTNASTTGLLDARTSTWSDKILGALGIPPGMLPPLRQPGTVLGSLSAGAAARTGLSPSVVVTTVASHDTASAVVAVPAESRHFAYISSGTWSLVGTELDGPIMSAEARSANFTNERGFGGTTRFLRNVGGLWLLQESLRNWADQGQPFELRSLLKEATALPEGGPLFNVDDPELVAPNDMPARVRAAIEALGQAPPASPAALVRSILDSLAAAYARTVDELTAISGLDFETIHVVGGGSRNGLLCQLTADAADRGVAAGPAEATALGNGIMQAGTSGALPSDPDEVRHALTRLVRPHRYLPGAR